MGEATLNCFFLPFLFFKLPSHPSFLTGWELVCYKALRYLISSAKILLDSFVIRRLRKSTQGTCLCTDDTRLLFCLKLERFKSWWCLTKAPSIRGSPQKGGGRFALTGFKVCVISCRMAFAFTAPHVAPCPDFYTCIFQWNIAWAWVNSAQSEWGLLAWGIYHLLFCCETIPMHRILSIASEWVTKLIWMETRGKMKDANGSSCVPGRTEALAKLWANKRLFVPTLVKRVWTQLEAKGLCNVHVVNGALTRSKHLCWAPVAICICC